MRKNITKKFIIPVSVLGLAGMLVAYSVVLASGAATVAATVTLQNISLSVADGSISYGTLAANSTKSTCTSELNDQQTITNNGNVAETFNIQGQNSANWQLAATAGTDQYVEKFTTSTCTTWSGGTALTTSYATVATGVAASGTVNLNLQINTPTVSTYFNQQNVDVSLQAVAS
jgi:hypothetical protein